MARNSSVNFQLTASDPDGDLLQYVVASPPLHGTVTLLNATTGAVTYSPALGYCGPDFFGYIVSDGLCSASGTVSITVCTCPVADDGSVSVDQDASVNFQLSASDADGDPLEYAITLPPAHGALVVTAATGVATYAPSPGYCGPDSFRFKVRDPTCESPEATISITVNCADADGDGVPDGQDDCPDSDLRESVWIGECDTGLPNLIGGAIVDTGGCSLADHVQQLLDDTAAGADNSGRAIASTIKSLHALAGEGLIDRSQIGAIVRCIPSELFPQ